MKGRNPSSSERKWMDTVATYGCWCCRQMDIQNDYISLHHTQGRTKPKAHYYVIPLCDRHHEYWSEDGFHNNPGAWRKKWGRESEILEMLFEYFDFGIID